MPSLDSPASVIATLNYYASPKDGGKPYQKAIMDLATGNRAIQRNWTPVEVPNITIENARGREHEISVDKTGFQFFHHVSKHTSFENEEEIKAEYYPESVELIKKLTGATRVEIFDHSMSLVPLSYHLPSEILTFHFVQ